MVIIGGGITRDILAWAPLAPLVVPVILAILGMFAFVFFKRITMFQVQLVFTKQKGFTLPYPSSELRRLTRIVTIYEP